MDRFWSIFTMPIGLLFCFGPAILVWVRMELKDSRTETERDKKDR